MHKRKIKYMTFDDEPVEVEDVFYFHISKPELIEMEVEMEGGLGATIQRIIEEKDNKKLIAIFKKVVLDSFGEKSPDGKSFVKSPELSKWFSQTAAYEVLYMELATNDGEAAKFIEGIMPKDLADSLKAMDIPDKPKGIPEISKEM